ncbi:hypothetical protein SEUCBS139899_003352 [Sporothrix eucalyptigena]
MSTVNGHAKAWWKEAIVYQIYPSSFYDSNGDGIGDLQGIISKLDYLKDLGVDVIWVCPIYQSPQIDMGYDISDYENIHPPYGTVKDVELLIKEAHLRGMKLMLDLVINHTSDQHAWFKESRSSRTNPKSDWYIWQPARRCPTTNARLPPNNWRSCFGNGSVWEWDETRQEYYLHLYAVQMPDLNWENEECRKAIYKSAIESWLEKGVDGFRVDLVNLYSKLPGFPDAPIIDPSAEYQLDPTMYANGPRIHEFIAEINAILAKYGAITVGELPATPDTAKVLEYVRASRKQLSMVFQFDIVEMNIDLTDHFNITLPTHTLGELRTEVAKVQQLIQGTDGWNTVFLENHDLARSVSRFTSDAKEHREQAAKLLALLQACLTGTQYVYQGQEIGSVNAPKESYPLENYLDIDTVLYLKQTKEKYGDDPAAWERAFVGLQHLARDHARIPIAWDGDAPYGGFSAVTGGEAREPWMKPHPLAAEINVKSQVNQPGSVYSFWRDVIHFRKSNADLFVYGNYETVRPEDEHILTFLKKVGEPVQDMALVVFNFTAVERRWSALDAVEVGLDPGRKIQLSFMMGTHQGKNDGFSLAPFEGRVYRIKWDV